MGSIGVRVTYRPVRVGFIVKEGQIDDLVKASRLAALFWGGINNPVLPVGQDTALADRLIRLFQVDVLHEVSSSTETHSLMERHDYLRPPSDASPTLFYEDWHTKRQEPCYLDVLHIIDHYWEHEFKHTRSSNCVLLKWNASDELAGLFTLMFGQYARDELNLKDDYEDSFIRGLRAITQTLSKDEAVPEIMARAVSPLRLTRDRLVSYQGGLSREDGIFVGKASDFWDLVSFWNVRASGIDVAFFDSSQEQRMRTFVEKILAEIDSRPNRHPNLEDWIGVYYHKDEERVRELLNSFKPKKQFCLTHISDVTWNGLNIRPALFHFEPQGSPGTYEEKYGRTTVSFSLPDKPLGTVKANDMQSLVASIEATVEFEDETETLRLPYLPELNEYYSRAIHLVDPGSVRVEQQSVGLIIRGHTDGLSLFPIPVEELLFKIFEWSGLNVRFSHPGLLAKQIIRKMGHIESCRVFKIRGVRRLLHPSMNREVTWGEAKKIIWQDDFSRFHDLYIEPRKASRLTPDDTWKYLLRKRAFRPRLKVPWVWLPREG